MGGEGWLGSRPGELVVMRIDSVVSREIGCKISPVSVLFDLRLERMNCENPRQRAIVTKRFKCCAYIQYVFRQKIERA